MRVNALAGVFNLQPGLAVILVGENPASVVYVRNKVRAWFRKQEASENKLEGRAMLDREIQRLGVNTPSMPELLAELKLESAEDLHEALGLGEVNTAQVAARCANVDIVGRLHVVVIDDLR